MNWAGCPLSNIEYKTGSTGAWLHKRVVGGQYPLEGVLAITSLCFSLQGLEIVTIVLDPNMVRYFYHRGVGRENMFDEFEVFNFI